jgi:hypothetical protein
MFMEDMSDSQLAATVRNLATLQVKWNMTVKLVVHFWKERNQV